MKRRTFLSSMALGSLFWLSPRAFAAAGLPTDKRLVVVFLRGAVDGLSVCVPWQEAAYRQERPHIALPPPGSGDGAALALDKQFALHPALAELLPLWKSGQLGFIHASGNPDPTRSHFDAQHMWETGSPELRSGEGWLNRLIGLMPAGGGRQGVSVGESSPLILRGNSTAIAAIQRGGASTQKGVVGNTTMRDALLSLYADDTPLARAFREGINNRTMTADELSAEMQAANNGAAASQGLAQDAHRLCTLMRAEPSLKIGFLSAGGWDTHFYQGNQTGLLANNLRNLAQGLSLLWREMPDRDNSLILVMSEFGRTIAENGSKGTDHGHGNVFWLLGGQVNGGRMHGEWPGLESAARFEGRDLAVVHDYRAILARSVRQQFALSDSRLADLFPGLPGLDPRLSTLFRR